MKPILLLLLATLTAQAATFSGKVVGVSDGDTITVLHQGNKQYRVRLQANDANSLNSSSQSEVHRLGQVQGVHRDLARPTH